MKGGWLASRLAATLVQAVSLAAQAGTCLEQAGSIKAAPAATATAHVRMMVPPQSVPFRQLLLLLLQLPVQTLLSMLLLLLLLLRRLQLLLHQELHFAALPRAPTATWPGVQRSSRPATPHRGRASPMGELPPATPLARAAPLADPWLAGQLVLMLELVWILGSRKQLVTGTLPGKWLRTKWRGNLNSHFSFPPRHDPK